MRPGTNHEMMPDDVDAVLVVGLDFADDMPQDVGPARHAWHVAALARIEAETGVALADLMPAPGTDPDPDYRTVCARLNAAGFDTFDSDTTLEAYSAPVTCGPDCARECAPVAPAAPEPPRRMTRADILELELDRLVRHLREAHDVAGHRWTWTGNFHAPETYSCACGLRAEPATVARLAHSGDPVTGVRSTIDTDDAGPARRMLRDLDRNASHDRVMAPDTLRTYHAELIVGTFFDVAVFAHTEDEAREMLEELDPENPAGSGCNVAEMEDGRHVVTLQLSRIEHILPPEVTR